MVRILIHLKYVKHPYFHNAIVIGNDNMIPVLSHGQLSFPSSQKPLTLKNVLHAPINSLKT